MRKTFILFVWIFLNNSISAQLNINYNPNIQPKDKIQYFKPVEDDLFVGDCIPFSHDGTFYLYWLLDKGHHSMLNGLGAHQWALSTSKDLINWEHYPIALGIDEEWEKSICTGSVIYANNAFYAFYATRLVKDGKTQEQLSYAISKDGKNYIKQKPNPFFVAPTGYNPSQFRDPKIISAKDGYHMFISSYLTDPELFRNGGCLAHLFSKDLKNWEVLEPVISGQRGTPECSDYFFWNGWYYIVYSVSGRAYYMKSRNSFGPWEFPRYQAMVEPFSNVTKTAEFKNNRRIAAAWVPSRNENKDDGNERFGGNVVLRELIQEDDGTLCSKFPSEVIPKEKKLIDYSVVTDKSSIKNKEGFQIISPDGIGSAKIIDLPYNCRITLEIEPAGNADEFGIYLRTNDKAQGGYRLNFSPNKRLVQLGNVNLESVEGLNNTMTIDIIMMNDIIDVCINNSRCIANRCPEQKGNQLWFYTRHGDVKFKSIRIAEI